VGQALAPREAVALADFRAVGDVVDGVDVRAGKIEDELFPVVFLGSAGNVVTRHCALPTARGAAHSRLLAERLSRRCAVASRCSHAART
jgi:hypothetical protein